MSTSFFLPPASLQLLQLQLMSSACDASAIDDASSIAEASANDAVHRLGGLLAKAAPGALFCAPMTVHSLLKKFIDDFATQVDLGERKLSTLMCYVRWCGIAPDQWPRQKEPPKRRRKTAGEPAGVRNFRNIIQRPVLELTAPELKTWVREVARDVGTRRAQNKTPTVTANRCLDLLDGALKWAASEGLIPHTWRPTAPVKRFREKPRQDYFEVHEVVRLLQALRQLEAERVLAALPWRQEFAQSATQALILMLLTGMRHFEVLELRVEEVNLESRVLRLADTKSGPAEVPLSMAAAALLRDQLARARHGWVFPSQQGGPIQSVYHVWRKALCMAGLKSSVVPHVARHTIASLLKKHGGKYGVGTKQISALMRHLNERTTEMIYQHVQATEENLHAADVYSMLVGEQNSLTAIKAA